MIPLKMFLAQKVMPEKGMQLSLDGMLVKILSVSGGRVLVDFNNPLSGKVIIYEYTIKRIVTDTKEKINSLQEFFFRNKFEFDLDEAKKEITFKVPENVGKFLFMFEKQFNDILGMKILTKEPEKKAEEKKE
jgi:FKBP-type peptidyl-prolyl cis-trans isomerase 2